MSEQRTKRFRLSGLVAVVALLAAACGSSAESSDTESQGAETSSAESAESSASPTGSAVLPDALCADGAIIAGVLDIATLKDLGMVGPETGDSALGDPFSAEEWAADPYHSCGVTATDGFIDISINTSSFPPEGTVEVLQIGGQTVTVTDWNDRIDAVVELPDANGGPALTMKITAVAYEDAGLALERVVTLAERVVPAVTAAAPPASEVAEPEVAEPSDDPYAQVNVWQDENTPAWVDQCEGGDLFACDFLWYAASSESAEFEVGISCGGTREATFNSRCVEYDLEPITEGDHPLLDELTAACRGGDLNGCLRMQSLVSGASAYYDYANACVSEIKDGAAGCSAEMFADGSGA